MSRAGTKSNQGDDYQIQVALHWLIRLLSDEDIAYIQAESNGLPGIDEKISVDDVVVAYEDGRNRCIQVKKNQPRDRAWSLSDLKDELPKIRDQLETKADALVELYSGTPFGHLRSIAKASREYPDLLAFEREAGEELKKTLSRLAGDWSRTKVEAFGLLSRLRFGPHHSSEEWDRQNRQELSRLVPHVSTALPVLEKFLRIHQSKLQAANPTIRREDVWEHLRRMGLVPAPMLGEEEILAELQRATRMGRDWRRTVGGRKFRRPELDDLIRKVESGVDTILVTDRPGSGKTCLLLDLADYIEENTRFGLLFIKGDRFIQVRNENDFKAVGLPEDIVGLCGRLSEYRRVAVIVDSLDVLSMNRDHGALRTFLHLIDRLGSLKGVSVISACRSFDLKYDPLLRDRKWGHVITLADFDYEEIVAPLLKEWGVAETRIDEDLKKLLRLPQNLRLFEAVARRSDSLSIRNAYELHEIYLDEAVRKSHGLDDAAIAVLQKLADRLLRDRAQLIPLAAFPGDESVRHALASNGVLYQEPGGRRIGFGHQSLFDFMAVHSSLAQGRNLSEFIKAHPPLPFLRPAVRTFVLFLRTHAPDIFSRQVWQALTENDIAYHFKRLIVESLAEISPDAKDWPLVRRLFHELPELFRRLFWKIQGDVWFRLMVDHWLPSLDPSDDENEWHIQFVSSLSRWMNSYPLEVIGLWRKSLSEDWIDRYQARRISLDLRRFKHWRTEGIAQLIETLMQKNKTDRDWLGPVISRYVAATDQGDDLLWRYIVKDIEDKDIQFLNFRDKLLCRPHQFHYEQFFKDRLVQSTVLLRMAVDSLEEWAARSSNHSSKHQLRSAFLHGSSWERRHSRLDQYEIDSLTVLLDGIENSFIQHAMANDAWWREYEPKLRYSGEETLRYFLIKSYSVSPETNVEGIGAILTDKELLRYGQIEYELGELAQTSYHLLGSKLQETIQRIFFDLHEDENFGEEGTPDWVFRNRYNYLVCIPAIFRLPESQSFIDRFQRRFGSCSPEPIVYSCGGWVSSPISSDRLLSLDAEPFFRLLDYYNDYHDESSHPSDHLKGGHNEVKSVLEMAAALYPTRYMDLAPELERRGLKHGYLVSLLAGIANHLRYRFGRLRPPQEWRLTQPEPDGPVLAKYLLNMLESRFEFWEDCYATVRMFEACCEVLDDSESTVRLVFLLYRFLKHSDPKKDKQKIFRQGKDGIAVEDLRHQAINSVRGIAAKSAIGLCNRLIEQEQEPCDLLFPVLRLFARDPVQAVRAALLERLPYLAYKRRSWGMILFDDIFDKSQTHLWALAERYLYHQYHDHFDYVAPLLHRMRNEAPKEAADAWGRIVTLAALSGHIDQENLFGQLESMNSTLAWKGAAQVFAANLDRHKQDGLCLIGLCRILELEEKTEQLFNIVERAFDPKKHGRFLDDEFAIRFIDAIEPGDNTQSLFHFLEWIAWLAGRNPVSALKVCEHLSGKLSALNPPPDIWRSEPLISALSAILREADETDDEVLIRRAVRLQDKFLRLDIHGMDQFFEMAGQN